MPIPRVAIVGRPNVGKSSLLNLIARELVAIVDPTPGVTRDRVGAIVDLEAPGANGPDKPIELIDTGGYGVYTAEGGRYDEIGADLAALTPGIEAQIAGAVATADLILFCVDAQAGVTPQDHAIAKLLREGKFAERGGVVLPTEERPPVQLVATKVDGPSWEAHGYEVAALGFGEPWLISSKTNYFRRDLLDRLYEALPEPSPEDERPHADIAIAIVGKRNAGKSSLVNALCGEERVIVSEIAGTTRDAVDVHIDYGERSVMLIDTAGHRRRKSFQGAIEYYASDRVHRAIKRSDVVLLMIDSTSDISQVDEQLAQLVADERKPVAICINKWDLVEQRIGPKGRAVSTEDYEAYIRRELKGLSYAPIAFLSATEGLNLSGVIDLAFDLKQQAETRVGTGELNRVVRALVEHRGPTNKLGQHARVYFAAQVTVRPPTIVLIVNDPKRFETNYERYLINRFREELPFGEVPIRLILRSKKRLEEQQGKRSRGRGQLHTTDAEGGFAEDLAANEVDDLLAALPDDPDAYFDD